MSIFAKPLPPAEFLHACFRYDDGSLYWKSRPRDHFKSDRAWNMWNAKYADKRAGRTMQSGDYRQVGLNDERHLEHRVIAAMFGLPCDQLVDHRSGETLNNRIGNLRPASQQQNMRNSRGWAGKAERVGVCRKPNGRYVAYIRRDGKHTHLGTFVTEEEATRARIAAETLHYGDFSTSASREVVTPC